MDLLRSLATPPQRSKSSCYASKWIASCSAEEQKAVEAALRNPQWNTTSLHKLFKEAGFSAQYSSLQRHRTHTCSCALVSPEGTK